MPAMSVHVNASRKTLVTRGQMPNGFPDDFKVTDNGVYSLLIRLELLETQTADVLLDFGDRFEDVLGAQAPFSRRQQPPREGFDREAEA